MRKKIEVDFSNYHRVRRAIDDMQGQTFFCQDEGGVLRRWYPPRPLPPLNSQEAK